MKAVPVTIKCVPQEESCSRALGGRKAPNSMDKISTLGVLRLRTTSAVSRDKSVRRSAQDDDFVEVLKRRFRGSFEEKHPKQVCAMGSEVQPVDPGLILQSVRSVTITVLRPSPYLRNSFLTGYYFED